MLRKDLARYGLKIVYLVIGIIVDLCDTTFSKMCGREDRWGQVEE